MSFSEVEIRALEPRGLCVVTHVSPYDSLAMEGHSQKSPFVCFTWLRFCLPGGRAYPEFNEVELYPVTGGVRDASRSVRVAVPF